MVKDPPSVTESLYVIAEPKLSTTEEYLATLVKTDPYPFPIPTLIAESSSPYCGIILAL